MPSDAFASPADPRAVAHAIGLFQRGDTQVAIGALRELARAHPGDALLRNNLGYALQGAGRLDEAVATYREALALAPGLRVALRNLAGCHLLRGESDAAIGACAQAVRAHPGDTDAWIDLGNALQQLGRRGEAHACYDKVLALSPSHEGALNNKGLMLAEERRADEAVRCYRQALAAHPDAESPRYNLARLLADARAEDEALPHYLQVWQRNPAHLGALGSAITTKQQLCDWNGLDALSQAMLTRFDAPSAHPCSPFTFLSLGDGRNAREQLACARRFAAHRRAGLPGVRAPRPAGGPPGRPLRIGYVSQDFRQHATTALMAELFELHDRARVEVIACSFGEDDASAARERVVRACDRFIDLHGAPDGGACARIRAQAVDILVDLNGHTAGSRLRVFQQRCAPVQVNWLGYPGTMGDSAYDFIVSDGFVSPPGCEDGYSERIVRLPGCYQVNDRKREVAPARPRAAHGLPDGGLVFASFNQTYKITPAMFDVWMALLREVPDSVLWLYSANAHAPGNLKREAQARGVDANRLVFAPTAPPAEHLARYHCADLCLDTFPVTSHTTGSDALWVGCPLLTCAGDTFVSRVAGSLLVNVGLGELVTRSFGDYLRTALALAREPQRLAAMRRHLRDGRAGFPLFDTPRFVRGLEDAFETMWTAGARDA